MPARVWTALTQRARPLQLGAGVGAAALCFVLLLVVARPGDHGARQEALMAGTARLEARAATLRAAPAGFYGFCDDPAAEAQAALQARLLDAANGAGLTFDVLDTRSQRSGPVARVSFSGQTRGAYERIIALFEALGGDGPTVFVERADLTAAAEGVALELEGSVLCSIPAS